MRTGDLIVEFEKHKDHEYVCILFRKGDVPFAVEQADGIEPALMGGFHAAALVFCDTAGREELWYSHTFHPRDMEFVAEVLECVVAARAELMRIPMFYDGAGDA